MSKQDQLNALIAPAVTALGFEFVGLELIQHGRGATLRIFIDHPDKVNVDDCAKVSYQVGSILDVEDPIQGEYRLEVSSPGIDRPLFTAAHYAAQVGQVVKLKMAVPHKGRRNFKGQLVEVKDDSIVLTVDKETVELSLAQVERGNLVPDYEALFKEANAKDLH